MNFNDSNLSTSKKILNVEVGRITSVRTHPDPDLSHLSVNTILGRYTISGKLENGEHRYPVDSLAVFLPVGTVIPLDLLKRQGFYWDAEKDRGLLKGNKRNRVGAVTRGSVTSEGILFPLEDYDIDRAYLGGKVTNGRGGQIDVMRGDILNEFYGITEFKD